MEKRSTETERSTTDAVERTALLTRTDSNESQEDSRSRRLTGYTNNKVPSRKFSFGNYFAQTKVSAINKKQAATTTWTWTNHKSVIIGRSPVQKTSNRIAMFDMDGTIIVNKTGRRVIDWEFFDSSVPQKLRELNDQGYRIILATN